MKICFTKHGVIAIHAEVAEIRKRVYRKILVRREDAVSHKSDKIYHLRLLEKLATWRRNNDFDRSEVLAERQGRIQ